jgi:methyl-accepting chemotaxis protein
MKSILMKTLVALLSIAFLCLFAGAQSEKQENLLDQDLLIKSEVETAVSMLQAIYAKHQQGAMTLKKAKELGADLLRELKYGSEGYFWADTTEGVNRSYVLLFEPFGWVVGSGYYRAENAKG